MSLSDDCEHLCVNTEGSYSCACREGFALDNTTNTCLPSCGGELTGVNGSFHTPDWPDRYPQVDFICVWTIALAQQSVRFEVDSSAYGINGRPPCLHDHIEFFNGTESGATSLGKFCKLAVPEPIVVPAPGARVVFQGKRNLRRPTSRVGVRIFFQVLGENMHISYSSIIIIILATVISKCPASDIHFEILTAIGIKS